MTDQRAIHDPSAPDGTSTTVMAVHENTDGYWYIGAGRSIADGPYRYPQQLLTVASDLLACEARWRIDVFDVAGRQIISYRSEDVAAGDLDSLRHDTQWRPLETLGNSSRDSSH
jgi:hypothetical protein